MKKDITAYKCSFKIHYTDWGQIYNILIYKQILRYFYCINNTRLPATCAHNTAVVTAL